MTSLDTLPDDIVYLIFRATDLDTRYFRICTRFAAMREELVVKYEIFNAPQTAHSRNNLRGYFKRHTFMHILLTKYMPVEDKYGHKKYILYFIASKNRKETICACKNSYHRKLVHMFCDTHGLLHETVQMGWVTSKRSVENCDCGRPGCGGYTDKYIDRQLIGIKIKKTQKTQSVKNTI